LIQAGVYTWAASNKATELSAKTVLEAHFTGLCVKLILFICF